MFCRNQAHLHKQYALLERIMYTGADITRPKRIEPFQSDDRVVLVKKSQGQHTIIVKQKDSDVKCVEFTPNR